MEQPLTYLKNRINDDWLIGYDSQEFTKIAEQLYFELIERSHPDTPPKIILAERNPIKFLAGFIAATSAGCPVFLCNPDWVKAEWEQVLNLVQPDIVWGQEAEEQARISDVRFQIADLTKSAIYNLQSAICNQSSMPNTPLIMIPTGGSSGQIRFVTHTWETLMTSVQGFIQYFQVSTVNSFCVLPLYHVSGLLQFLRSFTTSGRLLILPFKALESGAKCDIKPEEFFISLVPTQLQRLLQSNPIWLSQFHTVLLGGAPAWKELLETARHHRIRLAPTYGMTETASQIVTLKPEDFLNGNNSCGQVLPHAKVTIRSANGELLASKHTGIITIQADSLSLGYYPDSFLGKAKRKRKIFQPDDLGFFDEQGYLTLVGRNSHKIITGGENVFPSEVEAAIQSTNLVTDVCVIGLPDHHWGQVVTAIYVPKHSKVSNEIIKTAIEHKLSKFKRPKHWYSVETLPRNAQGKVNYEQLKQIAMAWHLNHHTGAAIE